MKKFLLLAATAAAVAMLSAPMAYAAPSPTESDRTPTEFEDLRDPDVPLGGASEESEALENLDEPNVPLDGASEASEASEALENLDESAVPLSDATEEFEDLVELGETEIPLAASPQTGESGLSGLEALALTAMAFTASGTVMLAKTRKQTESVC